MANNEFKIIGKRRGRQAKARQALEYLKSVLPTVRTQAAFDTAYPTANQRNEAYRKSIEALVDIGIYAMKALKEDDQDD